MPERLRGVITTRRYTNPHSPLPLENSLIYANNCILFLKKIKNLKAIVKIISFIHCLCKGGMRVY